MSVDYKTVQNVIFGLANGVSIVYPAAAPIVAFIEKIILVAESEGIQSHEITAEQATAIMAGMAAAKSSAVTDYKQHAKDSFAQLKKE